MTGPTARDLPRRADTPPTTEQAEIATRVKGPRASDLPARAIEPAPQSLPARPARTEPVHPRGHQEA